MKTTIPSFIVSKLNWTLSFLIFIFLAGLLRVQPNVITPRYLIRR